MKHNRRFSVWAIAVAVVSLVLISANSAAPPNRPLMWPNGSHIETDCTLGGRAVSDVPIGTTYGGYTLYKVEGDGDWHAWNSSGHASGTITFYWSRPGYADYPESKGWSANKPAGCNATATRTLQPPTQTPTLELPTGTSTMTPEPPTPTQTLTPEPPTPTLTLTLTLTPFVPSFTPTTTKGATDTPTVTVTETPPARTTPTVTVTVTLTVGTTPTMTVTTTPTMGTTLTPTPSVTVTVTAIASPSSTSTATVTSTVPKEVTSTVTSTVTAQGPTRTPTRTVVPQPSHIPPSGTGGHSNNTLPLWLVIAIWVIVAVIVGSIIAAIVILTKRQPVHPVQ